MKYNDVEKAKILNIADMVEYVPNSVVVRIIEKRATGNISAVSFDSREAWSEVVIPFDTFIEIIEGKTDIEIDGVSNILNKGQSIIIPAHTQSIIRAMERFKMIKTIIKCGYEDEILS